MSIKVAIIEGEQVIADIKELIDPGITASVYVHSISDHLATYDDPDGRRF